MPKETEPVTFTPELVNIADLKPHPRNYRKHPPDQIGHIKASIQQHGFYRNIIIAQDGTILAGHGCVIACTELDIVRLPAIRLPINPDSPAALKVLAGDNEIGHLGEIDDRILSEVLRDISTLDNLLGTGYDENMLANLVFITRPESEIPTMDAAALWAGAGMPEYQEGENRLKLSISFENDADRARFVDEHHLRIDKREAQTWMTRWPYTEREDLKSVRFDKVEAEA